MKLQIGQNYYIRDVNDQWVGELVSIDGPFTVTLKNASWVADSGRLSVFLKEGKAINMEIEFVGTIQTMYRMIREWGHKLFDTSIPS